jgi:hypothetical protein
MVDMSDYSWQMSSVSIDDQQVVTPHIDPDDGDSLWNCNFQPNINASVRPWKSYSSYSPWEFYVLLKLFIYIDITVQVTIICCALYI